MNLKKMGNAFQKAIWKMIYWNDPVSYARKKGVTVGSNCNFTGLRTMVLFILQRE